MEKSIIRTCKLGAFFLSACTNLLAPLLLAIRAEFSLNTAMSGALLTAFFAGNFALCFFSGRLLNRFSKGHCLCVAVTIMTLSCFGVAVSPSFPVLWAGLFLMGACTIVMQVATNAIATGLAQQGAASHVAGITAFNGLGACAGLLFAGQCVSLGFSWRMVYILFGLCSIVATVLCWKTKFIPMPQQDAGHFRDLYTLVSDRRILPFFLCLLLYSGSETSICNWLVTYAVENRGFTTFAGSILTALIWLFVFVGRMACSEASKRVPARWILSGLMPVAAVTTLLIPQLSQIGIWAAVVVLGLALSGIWPMLASELLRIGGYDQSVTLSTAFLFSFCGNTVIPYGIGQIAEFQTMPIAILSIGGIFAGLFFFFLFAAHRPCVRKIPNQSGS